MKDFNLLYSELQKKENEIYNIWNKAKNEKNKLNIIVIVICILVDIIIFKGFKKSVISFDEVEEFKITFLMMFSIWFIVVDSIIYFFIHSIFGKQQKEYLKKYKDIIIGTIIRNFYTNLEYFSSKAMPKYIYEEAKYNEYYNRYGSEDYFEANLDSTTSIQMAEVITKKVTTRRNSRGRSTTTTTIIFHGLFAKLVIDKSINSELKIMRNGKFFGDNRLQMDSSEFEKYFDVQASNKIKGMQLLTADVMAELIDFQNKTNMKYDIVIKNNNIYLRFHSGSMFEPKNINNGAIDKDSIEKYFYMLNFIYNLSNKLIKVINETEL